MDEALQRDIARQERDADGGGPAEQPRPHDRRGQQQLIDWDTWWRIIIHRNADIVELPEPPPKNAYTNRGRRASPPFPFNLEATWYCGMVMAVLLSAHCELDTQWLHRRGYVEYFLRIAIRAGRTVALSINSTLWFEVFLNIFDLARVALLDRIALLVDTWFVRLLGWGLVNDRWPADLDDVVELHPDPTHLREPIRRSVIGIVVLAFNFFVTMVPFFSPMPLDPQVTGSGKLGGVEGAEEKLGLGLILWEFGMPAVVQTLVAVFFYLLAFVFVARAETPVILRRGMRDPLARLVTRLLRATAMHLLAYTAYQMVCIAIVNRQNSAIPFLDDFVFHFLLGRKRIYVQFFPVAGTLIVGAHLLLKSTCKLCVNLFWPWWVPYIAWMSLLTEASVWSDRSVLEGWEVFDEDMDVFHPGTRVLSRAAMTVLFGLGNSWPARLRLSELEGVD